MLLGVSQSEEAVTGGVGLGGREIVLVMSLSFGVTTHIPRSANIGPKAKHVSTSAWDATHTCAHWRSLCG